MIYKTCAPAPFQNTNDVGGKHGLNLLHQTIAGNYGERDTVQN